MIDYPFVFNSNLKLDNLLNGEFVSKKKILVMLNYHLLNEKTGIYQHFARKTTSSEYK